MWLRAFPPPLSLWPGAGLSQSPAARKKKLLGGPTAVRVYSWIHGQIGVDVDVDMGADIDIDTQMGRGVGRWVS